MRFFIACLLVTGSLVVPAWAQPPGPEGSSEDRPKGDEMRQRIIKEFDEDGDGKLNDEERHKAREAVRARSGRRGPEGELRRGRPPRGRDGEREHGPRGPEGRRDFRGPNRPGGPDGGPPAEVLEMLFNQFDKDKNESLSRDEFEKLARFVRKHRPGPPPGGPPRGPHFGERRPDGPPPRGDRESRRGHRPDGPPGGPGGPQGPPPADAPPRDPGPPPHSEDNPDDSI